MLFKKFSKRLLHASSLSFTYITLIVLCTVPPSQTAKLQKPPIVNSQFLHEGHGVMDHSAALNISRAIAGDHSLRNDLFRTINRRSLAACWTPYPSVKIQVDAKGKLANVQTVTVTVSGVSSPNSQDWIAVLTPSNASTELCSNLGAQFFLTGDMSSHPNLCHYPVKYKLLSSDPKYLSCGKKTCNGGGTSCIWFYTCSGSVSFRLINIRTDLTFVFFNGLTWPCVVKATAPVPFKKPESPLYGHLASVDSTGTQMKLTWVSGDSTRQQVKYMGRLATSNVTNFTRDQMCTTKDPSPASSYGWHDPGSIHSAVMTGLTPSTPYTYSYGSDTAGWSLPTNFTTPPAVGASTAVRVVIYGDMGTAKRDNASMHYSTPGAAGVVDALKRRKDVDVVFHIGDISYATGFLVEWDSFLESITPVASRVPYMTAIGNHERDYPRSGSFFTLGDSGGECGKPYEAYFQMPTTGVDKPWYSYSSGPIHFTVMSTEHDWRHGSEQYNWLEKDLKAVNRTATPWVIFLGHRPPYSSTTTILAWVGLPRVDPTFGPEIEPLLLRANVDLAVWGHVHNYERTCALYNNICLGSPTKDSDGVDTFDNSDYKAPVHVVVGTAGFEIDLPPTPWTAWSLRNLGEYGYSHITANKTCLTFKFMSASNATAADHFSITR